MSIRPQTSPLERLNSLTMGDSERKAFGSQQKDSLSDSHTENTGQGLVQRCVVVQRDQLGFGFTVCGERIKLVQNVRPGGAAVKAGVQEGDRIIKVNGSLVSSMSHQEVVKLIKSGTYVALTLQGPPPSAAAVPLQPLPTDISPNHRAAPGGEAPPPPPPPLPPTSANSPSQRITGPKPLQHAQVQKHASQILRKMLQQEEADLQDLLEEMSRNPSPSLEERIESAKRRAHQVRVKVQQDLDGSRAESGANYLRAGEGSLSMDSTEGDYEAYESPHSSPSISLRAPSYWRSSSDIQSSSEMGVNAQIIGPEEEDEEEVYSINESNGPFQDIELLKTRPAHMTVFMRYVFSQLLDPSPLLFYLSVEAYLGSSPKDARALVHQICSHFLDPDAPLKIRVREEFLSDIDSRIQAQEDIRGPLSELQQLVLPDIQDQIQDYRSKQTMGLGSLFGEGDLQQLDGDPAKERQVVDRQVSALWEILSKHEEERSSALASAVLLYLRHTGVKLRDSRLPPGLSSEKDKWLPFFPKTKKLSSNKKEKDIEDKKRNPILKYIGKPRSTSQSMRSGNVRNIIQQFENHQPDSSGADGDLQRLSTSSLGDDILDQDSPTVSVRLARSESLKAQGEGRRRGAGAAGESVPRSRSDVDMDDCGEEREGTGLHLLHHSTSSSASSSSARSLENPTPPYTPRSRRKSIESPVALLPDAPALEEDISEVHNWQEMVGPEILAAIGPREVDRQAVIYELFTTEISHLRTLRVLDQVFFQKMRSVLSSDELDCIFPNLLQVYRLHAGLYESMKKLRESPIVQGIGDVMLARFEGAAGAEFQEQVSQLCCKQSQALDLIKSKQRRDQRFSHIIQECEASPYCRRLQLKDLLVSEMQRLTKYPLLLEKIIKHTDPLSPELPSLQQALVCCRGILQAVNEIVRETEHQHRLSQYQRRLDATPLERQSSTVAAQFKNLDLSTKKMIHEGVLTWRISKDKAIEVQALLLSDLLVLLQKGPDERLVLRCPSRSLGGAVSGIGDTKPSLCPVIRLDSLLVRPVATDNKALYVISTSEREIYELVAGTSSEKNTWKDLLEKTISLATGSAVPANNSMTPVSSTSLDMESTISSDSHVYQSENSMTEESMVMERESSSIDDGLVGLGGGHEQSNIFLDTHGQDCQQQELGVAEAALQDVERLKQLIFRSLEEDCWSQDSDDTPTNETANERSPFIDGINSEALEQDAGLKQWEHEEGEMPCLEMERGVQVVRRAEGAGSASFPDDISDVSLLFSQSAKPRGGASVHGNTFYLVLPQDSGETSTEGLIETINGTSGLGQQPPEMMPLSSIQQEVGRDTPCLRLIGQQQPEDLSHEGTLHHSQADIQNHVVMNMEEILHVIEELMAKLQKLRKIETAHTELLKTLTELPGNEILGDNLQTPPTVARNPSLEQVAEDGGEPTHTVIHSTGF
ncbi:rho guanine nucleotide exchange factor 11 isoform X2 [Scleropages formosus]|uniref:rho guanine nucleotide exchange factor 11 isoform X2 n=1 Tax=Scleropages formosus TaxID=113540 RepID=UPI0008785FFF|nr:rho guanine nucleotide exchange factor 11 isoform X2 [Scleropages formosus]